MSPLASDPFRNSELTIILVVSDAQLSRSFYLDLLGAELFRQYGGNSIVLKFLDHWILVIASEEPTADKPDIHFNPHHK